MSQINDYCQADSNSSSHFAEQSRYLSRSSHLSLIRQSGNNDPATMLRAAIGRSSVIILGKHPRCTRWHASATSVINSELQPNLAGRRRSCSPWSASLLGGLQRVESWRREGPCLHASNARWTPSLGHLNPFLLWSVGTTIHRCLIITNRWLARIEFSAFLASGTPEAPGAHNGGYRHS